MSISRSFILLLTVTGVVNFGHAQNKLKLNPAAKGSFDDKRSVIQLAELKYVNGEIVCDRDEPVSINLKTDTGK
ncbi:MAG: hypothetical protein ACHQFX_11270 [Chitinophagales bacterium]